MEAITKQFVLPARPQVTSAKMPVIYPWETTNLYNLCVQLYELARKTGCSDTFDEFKVRFGAYLESGKSLIDVDTYTGQYSVTPLPNVEQILRTSNKLLREDVTIQPIPYYETSNEAGGYTVIIGGE